ncbi:MAG: hypothetical protein K8F91_10060, partial [Candidatus Obscuribacterales bacterium]|nr:hypothetical protein [Candidatus Obscuribacterales bacterium]
PYALTAVAEGYADYAWEARGGGYSDTVTQEGGKLFEKRLAVARQWLEKAGPKRKSYPRWYSAASTIALGEGWDAEKFDATMDEGIKLFPTYYTLHFDRVYHLQPRWYGKEGDWEAYAAKADDQIGGEDGDMLYARIIWYVNRKRVLYKKNTIFSKSNVSWVRTARGFDLLAAKYNDAPDVLNAYARLAVAASDVEKAKKLFAKIGAEVTMEPWATTESNARNYFLKCRMWAFGKQ